jgi:uncharacterized repeat protein (TIGR03803 family)
VFDGTDGSGPQAAPIRGTDGKLYGTTSGGGIGAGATGTVWAFDLSGTLTSLHSFHGTDGSGPFAPLVEGSDGAFYGTTNNCSSSCKGTVFRIDTAGHLTTLHSFSLGGAEGSRPENGALLESTPGTFIGTAQGGPSGDGLVFTITSSGHLTTLHAFHKTDGSNPISGVIRGSDGNYYGVTFFGGGSACSGGCGTVYRMDSSGHVTTIHAFNGPDGAYPYGGLLEASDGRLYGTTGSGGGSGCGGSGCGTVFRVDFAGNFSSLHAFDGDDGYALYAGLIEVGHTGVFYGVTACGGIGGGLCGGVVFRIDTAAHFSVAHYFTRFEGGEPLGGLLDGGDDKSIYGVTASSDVGNGVIFKIDIASCGTSRETACVVRLAEPVSISVTPPRP